MQQINWYLSVFDNHKLMGNKKQIGNNGKLCQRNYRLAFWLEKIISFEFFTFTHFYQHTKKMTSFMCESHVSDKLGWCPVSDSNFSVSFKSGNVIKWTPLPPICQSSRRKQVSSSERGSYINISQSSSILQAGETKSYLRAYLRRFDFSRRTSDFQYCLTSNFNNSYYSRVWCQDCNSGALQSPLYSWLEVPRLCLAWLGYKDPLMLKHSSHS